MDQLDSSRHRRLKTAAASPVTEEGVFEAVVSSRHVDREGDIVEPAAFADALRKWAQIGKRMPLAWVHADGKGIADVIGHIDAATVRVDGDEVIAQGWIDRDTERGREAWRLVKTGTLSFSFGYLIPEGGAERLPGGGGLRIRALDVYEVSVVPIGPANNNTRVLAYKSMPELREQSGRIERELAEATVAELEPIAAAREPDPEPEPEPDPEPDPEPEPVWTKSSEELRADSTRIERELAEAAMVDVAVPEPEPEPQPDPKPPEPEPVPARTKSIEELREDSARIERELGKATVTELEPIAAATPDPEPGPEPAPDPKPPEPALTTKSLEDMRADIGKLTRTIEEDRLPTIPPRDLTPLQKALRAASGITDPREFAAALDGQPAADNLVLHVRIITPDEQAAITAGHVKAVWSAAFINNLPDSSFLYIEPGGEKDDEGKTTPRRLRHFPVKNADGTVDLPHLRNALARIPQSNLPQNVKDRLTATARRMLDSATKSVDVTDKEPAVTMGVRSVDPLRKRSEELALEVASDGMSLRKPPHQPPTPTPPTVDPDKLRAEARDWMFHVLSYSTE